MINSIVETQKLKFISLRKRMSTFMKWWSMVRIQIVGRFETRLLSQWHSDQRVYPKVPVGLSLSGLSCTPLILAISSANEHTLLTLFASNWDSRDPVSLSKDLVKSQRKMLFIISEVNISHRPTQSPDTSLLLLHGRSEITFHTPNFHETKSPCLLAASLDRWEGKWGMLTLFLAYETASRPSS